MKKRALILAPFGTLVVVGVRCAPKFASVKPKTVDRKKADLAAALWVAGIGCPTACRGVRQRVPHSATTRRARFVDPKDSTNTAPAGEASGSTANVARQRRPQTGCEPDPSGGLRLAEGQGVPVARGAPSEVRALGSTFAVAQDNAPPRVRLACSDRSPSERRMDRLRWWAPVMGLRRRRQSVNVGTPTFDTLAPSSKTRPGLRPDNFGRRSSTTSTSRHAGRQGGSVGVLWGSGRSTAPPPPPSKYGAPVTPSRPGLTRRTARAAGRRR